MTRLSLLSGGEKALGAIAFLFSLFLARPSPFYLLDEVEAALDDTNIGRFTELLRTYADRAQFIVITHQKRTMEAADVLYGVTMGAGRRLADRLAAPAARRRGRRDRVNDLTSSCAPSTCCRRAGSSTWVFGGWGEELRGLCPPREHADLDLLYPARDWERVDALQLDWIDVASDSRWKRAFELDGDRWSSCFLVERDEHGWFTQLAAPAARLAATTSSSTQRPSSRVRDRTAALDELPRRLQRRAAVCDADG